MAFNGPNKRRFVSHINVTPLVDVMLVLLIIFMVTAPMMQAGIDVSLPQADGAALKDQEEPLVVTIDRQKRIFLGSRQLTQKELRAKLIAINAGKTGAGGSTRAVLLRADEAVPYGFVVNAISEIRKAGIDKLGMVTEPTGYIEKNR